MTVTLDCDLVPMTCENFVELWEQKYYNGVNFHRLIPGFMVQGGDPKGNGTGGTSYYGKAFEDEFHFKLSHWRRGMLSMANSGTNSNGSQFFITFAPWTHLDGKHSVFGQLTDGKQVLDTIEEVPTGENDKPQQKIKIMDTNVIVNPYRDTIAQILEKQFEKDKKDKQEKAGGTWTQFKSKDKHKATKSTTLTIGKYMKK